MYILPNSETIEDCYLQLRTQSLYKSLLKKHTNILLNFSTLEISQDISEYLIEIEIKLTNQEGDVFFSDHFEWDILGESNKYLCVYLASSSSAEL